jgi:hypothetical protein
MDGSSDSDILTFSSTPHYFDKFFSSTKLMQMLLEKQIYACGTAQAGRNDWPLDQEP